MAQKPRKPSFTEYTKDMTPEERLLTTLVLDSVAENLKTMNAILMGEDAHPSRHALTIMSHAITAHREGSISLSEPLDGARLRGLIEELEADVALTQSTEYKKRAFARAPKPVSTEEPGEVTSHPPETGRRL